MSVSNKEKYRACNQRWGDFDSEYYIMLNAVDRLKELLEEHYGSLYKASQELGYHKTYLSKQLSTLCACPRVMTIKKLCQAVNCSINYAVLGYGNRTYQDCTGTFNNLLQLYKENYKYKRHKSLNVAVTNLKHNRINNIPLKYLIRIAREQNVTIDWLIGG